MQNLIGLVGLALVLGGCCCNAQGPVCCETRVAVDEGGSRIAANVEDDYFIGDLVLARLEQRSQKGMDEAREAVVAAVREVVGAGVDLRVWWSVLHVNAPQAKQEQVGRALHALRVEAGGEETVVMTTYDVAAFIKTLPIVIAMGPGTQKEIPREATLFEAIYFDLGLAEGAPGPGMRLHAGVLTVEASDATQAEVSKVLTRLRSQVASLPQK